MWSQKEPRKKFNHIFRITEVTTYWKFFNYIQLAKQVFLTQISLK